MKKFKFFSVITAGLLLTFSGSLNAHSGGGGDSRSTFSSTGNLTGLDQIYVDNMDFESVGGSQVSGGTVELITEPLTPEEIQRQEIEQQILEGQMESAFWSAVSTLMNVGNYASQAIVFGSGVALATLAAPGTVVVTTSAGVTYTLTAAGSVAVGTIYSVATTVASGGSSGDAAASGVQNVAISVLIPNAAPVVQGLVGLGADQVRAAASEGKSSETSAETSPATTTEKPPTPAVYHSGNYNGVTVTPTQTLYH